MRNNAVPIEASKFRLRATSIFLLSGVMLFVACGGTASAHKVVGRDGMIHACYLVKGKPRGRLRVVRGRARCHRGERKVAWVVKGAFGLPGVDGTQGSQGMTSDPTQSALDPVLVAQLNSLSARIDALEATLAGVANSDLLALVKSLPALESVCEQSEALTEQVNLVAEVVEGLGLNGALKTLGGVLEIPELPEPLATFSCPSF
ncbi:MAG: hypothetical protein ACJ75S_02295 [Solirubrobacterales bacterium]